MPLQASVVLYAENEYTCDVYHGAYQQAYAAVSARCFDYGCFRQLLRVQRGLQVGVRMTVESIRTDSDWDGVLRSVWIPRRVLYGVLAPDSARNKLNQDMDVPLTDRRHVSLV